VSLWNGGGVVRPAVHGGSGAAPGRRGLLLPLGAFLLSTSWMLAGCQIGLDTLDVSSVRGARMALAEADRYPTPRDETRPSSRRSEPPPASTGSVILGELIAIFPGLIVHGLGHDYAGDHQTARRLRHIGGFGYVMAAAGAGMCTGAYYLDNSTDYADGFAYSLYGAGGVIGVAGVGYVLFAWFYDMIDTPRAVETGGRPPPRSKIIEDLDIFD
jgi:hypothetical protein